MNIAIFEIYPKKKTVQGMIDAHLRNSLVLRDCLDADLLLSDEHYHKARAKKWDAFILSYASFYSPFKSIYKLLEENPGATRFFIANEYQLNLIAGYKPHYILTNFERSHLKYLIGSKQFNINLLLARGANIFNEEIKQFDCVYYGTFRPDRSKYFTEYLQAPIYLSTSIKNMKKFKHIGCNPIYLNKFDWTRGSETLNRFKYSLYIEDEYTHAVYNFLANRYYEAMFCNTVMFFDINCKNTINKSEIAYHFDPFYLVSNHAELIDKINACNQNFEKHLATQKQWNMNQQLLRRQEIEKIRNYILSHVGKNEKSEEPTETSDRLEQGQFYAQSPLQRHINS